MKKSRRLRRKQWKEYGFTHQLTGGLYLRHPKFNECVQRVVPVLVYVGLHQSEIHWAYQTAGGEEIVRTKKEAQKAVLKRELLVKGQ